MSTKIKASVGITKNIGNYESVRLDASEERDIVDGEDEKAAWVSLWKAVQDQIEEQLLEVAKVVN